MTIPVPARLLSLAIAALVFAGCSTHHNTTAEAASAADAASAEAMPAPLPASPPSPPPPPSADVRGGSLDSVTVTGRRVRAESRTMAKAMAADDRSAMVATASQARSGTLTAGDYDDLLNPQLYARYAQKYLQGRQQTALPFVDTRAPLKVRVLGRDGKPLAFAEVIARDGDGSQLRLHTAANGIALFFPALDQLSGRVQLEVSATGTQPKRRQVDLAALGNDHTVTVELPVTSRAPQALDLLLAIDTTGSMGDELEYLQAELDSIVAGLRKSRAGVDLRVGLVVYRDIGDDYVTRSFPLSSNLADLRKHLGDQHADGGGDYPEAVDAAFADANRFDWRTDAVKVMLHVADAPPHDKKAGAAWQHALALRERGVHIVPVAASGVADEAQYLMRSMAAVTQSRYLFLTDDSGVGLPHAEPDVACYIVTRLDGLIERVVASLLLGKRVEPDADKVLRRTGDYDRGVCLPPGKGRKPHTIAD